MTKFYDKTAKGIQQRKRLKQLNYIKKTKLKKQLEKLKKIENVGEDVDVKDTKDKVTKDTATEDTVTKDTVTKDVVTKKITTTTTSDTTTSNKPEIMSRQEKRSNHLKKTKKGQPILNNQIDLILKKLIT